MRDVEGGDNGRWLIAPLRQPGRAALSNDELIRKKYCGVRPAPGYLAYPDHSQKPALFRPLKTGQNTGVTLAESFPMNPVSAVSDDYFAHLD